MPCHNPPFGPLPALLHTLAVASLLSACGGGTPNSTPVSLGKPVVSQSGDRWLGRWSGPEGAALTVSKDGTGYQLSIESLDGPNTYQGKAVDQHIAFERNGVSETIRAATGAETGMKWLADEKNCLVIRANEGFCRD